MLCNDVWAIIITFMHLSDIKSLSLVSKEFNTIANLNGVRKSLNKVYEEDQLLFLWTCRKLKIKFFKLIEHDEYIYNYPTVKGLSLYDGKPYLYDITKMLYPHKYIKQLEHNRGMRYAIYDNLKLFIWKNGYVMEIPSSETVVFIDCNIVSGKYNISNNVKRLRFVKCKAKQLKLIYDHKLEIKFHKCNIDSIIL